MTPTEVAGLFATFGAPWWVAGGYAIELAVGRPVRAHADIDVLVLRRDQLNVQRVLAGWEWWAADPPGVLRPWTAGEVLPPAVHDIWCRPADGQPWRVQFMLDESSGSDWVSRRNPRLRRPIAELGHRTPAGIPFLAPEIQLLYKAARPRPKDEHDFTEVLPVLTAAQQQWLHAALTDTYGGHPWRDRLTRPAWRGTPGPPR
ncbi:MAG TPA: amino acid transporter [Pseudonocardiaceae bacterium]